MVITMRDIRVLVYIHLYIHVYKCTHATIVACNSQKRESNFPSFDEIFSKIIFQENQVLECSDKSILKSNVSFRFSSAIICRNKSSKQRNRGLSTAICFTLNVVHLKALSKPRVNHHSMSYPRHDRITVGTASNRERLDDRKVSKFSIYAITIPDNILMEHSNNSDSIFRPETHYRIRFGSLFRGQLPRRMNPRSVETRCGCDDLTESSIRRGGKKKK